MPVKWSPTIWKEILFESAWQSQKKNSLPNSATKPELASKNTGMPSKENSTVSSTKNIINDSNKKQFQCELCCIFRYMNWTGSARNSSIIVSFACKVFSSSIILFSRARICDESTDCNRVCVDLFMLSLERSSVSCSSTCFSTLIRWNFSTDEHIDNWS